MLVYINPIIKKYTNRPIKVKSLKFKINLKGNVYELNFENFVPLHMYDYLVITNEHSIDVTKRIVSEAGPLGNFLGKHITPRHLGFERLHINEVVVNENDVIPNLVSFLH